MEFISKSVKETQKIAQDLAKKIVNSRIGKEAKVLAFEGELGAGKTTFIQAFAKALGIEQNLTSPTFVLLKQYELPIQDGQIFEMFIHIDAYRLNEGKDLLLLGVGEMIKNPKNIIAIEWSERVADILPKEYIKVHLDHISEEERRIRIE